MKQHAGKIIKVDEKLLLQYLAVYISGIIWARSFALSQRPSTNKIYIHMLSLSRSLSLSLSCGGVAQPDNNSYRSAHDRP